MRGNGGLTETDAAKDKLAKLSLKIGCLAVSEAGHGRQPRQRHHEYRVMREPEQVQRLTRNPRSFTGRYGVIQ